MKKFKKIFAAIAASALVAAMSFTSMAASITIKSKAESETTDKTTYTYYKILNADILYGTNGEIQSVSYYVENEALAKEISGTNLFEVRKSADGTRWNVVANSNTTDAKEIATKFDNSNILNLVPDTDTGTFTQEVETGTKNVKAVATGLTDGYYLIKSSLGTVLAVQTTGEKKGVEIYEKNSYPSLTKEEDITTASYGDKITYTVKVDIPASAAAKDIVVVDTMSTGLTPFDGDDGDGLLDVTAKVGETVLSGAEAVTVSNNGNAINITIPATAVDKYKGNEVTLTYQAVLNNNAQPTKAQSNSAYLTYADYKSLISSVDVTTYGFELTKVDGAKKDPTDRFIPKAAGDAEFTLWDAQEKGNQIKVSLNSENKYRVLTSGETETKIYAGGINHSATIEGLAAGKTYYLQEEKAPTGYNKLTERKAITVVNGENAAAKNKVEVENNAGIQLPSTGGMGTTVFAIVGLLVMAGAAVTLIVKKRA